MSGYLVILAIGAGVLFGLSYTALFEAYYHGRVSVVAGRSITVPVWP